MSDHLLPEEIIWEILMRLPSRSLIRFKLVCKSWCSVISDPQFLSKYLLRLREEDNDLVLLLARRPRSNNKTDAVYSLLSNEALIQLSEPQPLPRPPGWYSYQGMLCSNGLICIYDSSHVIIWCPATGHFKTLPNSDIPNPPMLCTHHGSYEFGFGYDSNTKDYKVIKISAFFRDESFQSIQGISKMEIYSLKADCWRTTEHKAKLRTYDFDQGRYENHQIQGVKLPAQFHCPCSDHDKPATYVNGVFCWLAHSYGPNFPIDRIMWFRMSDEVIGYTKIPIHAVTSENDDSWVRSCFALSDRFIAFVLSKKGQGCFDVWVLLEFGVAGSWVKLFCVNTLPTVQATVWFWNGGGKVIMKNANGDLVLCDPFTGELQSLGIGGERYSLDIVSFKRGQIVSLD